MILAVRISTSSESDEDGSRIEPTQKFERVLFRDRAGVYTFDTRVALRGGKGCGKPGIERHGVGT